MWCPLVAYSIPIGLKRCPKSSWKVTVPSPASVYGAWQAAQLNTCVATRVSSHASAKLSSSANVVQRSMLIVPSAPRFGNATSGSVGTPQSAALIVASICVCN